MDDVLNRIKSFYKAQTIKDPVALATYVTRRYGTMDKFAMARGMVGKKNAKKWNPVKNTGTGGPKSGKSAGKQVQGSLKIQSGKKETKVETDVPRRKGKKALTGGGYFRGGKGTARVKKGLGIDKAQPIEDTRELAHHLSGPSVKRPKGGNKSLWHAGKAGSSTGGRAWHEYEGGIRSKDNAKEWNPIKDQDKYDSTGKRKRPKKEEKPARLKGKFAREGRGKGKGGELSYQPGFGGAKGGRGKGWAKPKKAMDILTSIQKAKFGGKPLKWEDLPRDPISFATNVLQDKGFKFSNLSAGTKGAKLRNKLSQGIRELIRDVPEAGKKEIKAGEIKDEKYKKEAKKMAREMENSWKEGDIKKKAFPSALANLLGFGAGWAMSDTFVEAPRGQMTPSQQREWERTVRSAMRRKKGLQKDGIDNLKTFYTDQSDTYTRKAPTKNGVNLAKNDDLAKKRPYIFLKDHAPIPPRQGLVWDEQKKHWTRPEHVGHTVSEVQGKKRIRGTGAGVHERSLASGRIGGKGAGSAEAGRRFRGIADSGVLHPHAAKHPSRTHTTPKKSVVNRFLRRKGHRTSM